MPAGLRCLCLSLLLALPACNRVETNAAPEMRPRPTGPNVLLVTIDTLRADHVGAYGKRPGTPTATPTLDGLALQGVVFEKAFAPTPITLPSHASILTGLTPPRHGVRNNGAARLAAEVETLAERFQAAGYDTGAVVGAMVLGPDYGLAQGFDFYDADMSSRRASAAGYPERSAEHVTHAALAWLGERSRPFFLWVHYYDPHAVYAPPPPFDEIHREDPYSGEIAYVDAQLARLQAALRATGQWERTLVAVTADHGESLGEHGEPTHAYTLYDAVLHVPLLLRGPGLPAGARIREVVSSVDLAPTLLFAADLPPLPEADGRELASLAGQPGALAPRPAYAETLATKLDHGWAPLFALRSERHLYVRAPRPELYDVERDPAQQENLLDPPTRAAARRAHGFESLLDTALAKQRKAEGVALDAAARAQLQALGYVIPEGPVVESGLDPKDGLPFVEPFERARALYADGHLDAAEAITRQLVERLPVSPGLHHLAARLALARQDSAKALEHAGQALAQAPRSASAHVLMGLARVAAGDLAGAVAMFEAALRLDPTHPEAHVGLLWRVALGGSLEEADAAAAGARSLRPRDARLRVSLGDTWDQLRRYERALDSYREAVALDPSELQAHLGVAVGLARRGALVEMRRHLGQAGPAGRALGARMRLAMALAARGEVALAEGMLREVVADRPDFAPARRVLALLLERTGRDAEAGVLRRGGA